jgi:hypothetical protein
MIYIVNNIIYFSKTTAISSLIKSVSNRAGEIRIKLRLTTAPFTVSKIENQLSEAQQIRSFAIAPTFTATMSIFWFLCGNCHRFQET